MKKILPSYLSLQMIGPLILSSCFFVTFLLIFELFKIIKLVLNKGIPLLSLFKIISYVAITFVPMAIPLAVLFSSIYVMRSLSQDSEYIAMRSIGFSRPKVMIPFMLIALIMALLCFSLNIYLIPSSTKKVKEVVTLLTSKGLLAEIKPGQFYTEIPDVTIFAEKIDSEGKNLESIFILFEKADHKQVIFSHAGELTKLKDHEFGGSGMDLLLKNGSISKIYYKDQSVEKTFFAEHRFPVSQQGFSPEFMQKESMLTFPDLLSAIKNHGSNKDKNQIEGNLVKMKVELFSRINGPITCLLFCFLGLILGIQKSRGDSKNSVLLSLIIVALYNVLYFSGVALARGQNFPPVLAVFLPTILGTVVSVMIYKKTAWVN